MKQASLLSSFVLFFFDIKKFQKSLFGHFFDIFCQVLDWSFFRDAFCIFNRNRWNEIVKISFDWLYRSTRTSSQVNFLPCLNTILFGNKKVKYIEKCFFRSCIFVITHEKHAHTIAEYGIERIFLINKKGMERSRNMTQ